MTSSTLESNTKLYTFKGKAGIVHAGYALKIIGASIHNAMVTNAELLSTYDNYYMQLLQ